MSKGIKAPILSKRTVKVSRQNGVAIHLKPWATWIPITQYFLSFFLEGAELQELQREANQLDVLEYDVDLLTSGHHRFQEFLLLLRNDFVTDVPYLSPQEKPIDEAVDTRQLLAAAIIPPYCGPGQNPELIPETYFQTITGKNLGKDGLEFLGSILINGIRVIPSDDFDVYQIVDDAQRNAFAKKRRNYHLRGTLQKPKPGRPSHKESYLELAQELHADGRAYPTKKDVIKALTDIAGSRGWPMVSAPTLKNYLRPGSWLEKLTEP